MGAMLVPCSRSCSSAEAQRRWCRQRQGSIWRPGCRGAASGSAPASHAPPASAAGTSTSSAGSWGAGGDKAQGRDVPGGCTVPSLCASSCSPSYGLGPPALCLGHGDGWGLSPNPAMHHPSRDPFTMPLLPSSPHFIPGGVLGTPAACPPPHQPSAHLERWHWARATKPRSRSSFIVALRSEAPVPAERRRMCPVPGLSSLYTAPCLFGRQPR